MRSVRSRSVWFVVLFDGRLVRALCVLAPPRPSSARVLGGCARQTRGGNYRVGGPVEISGAAFGVAVGAGERALCQRAEAGEADAGLLGALEGLCLGLRSVGAMSHSDGIRDGLAPRMINLELARTTPNLALGGTVRTPVASRQGRGPRLGRRRGRGLSSELGLGVVESSTADSPMPRGGAPRRSWRRCGGAAAAAVARVRRSCEGGFL